MRAVWTAKTQCTDMRTPGSSAPTVFRGLWENTHRSLTYLDLSWSQTHDARLAPYEISAALAGLQAANTAAEEEAAAEREATSMPDVMM